MTAHPNKLIGSISRPPGMHESGTATVVKGHTMGALSHNSIIFFNDDQSAPSPELLGELVIVMTADGRRLVRFLDAGTSDDRYNLRSVTGPTLENVALTWVERVLWIRPPIYGDPLLKHVTTG